MADASTPPPAPRSEEIAVAYGPRDRTRFHITRDGRLENEDRILQRWGGGVLDSYVDLLRDDQVSSAFQQRRSAVTSANWSVQPGGDSALDAAAALFLEENLQRVGWDAVTDLSLYGVFYGHSVAELRWAVIDGKWAWEAIKVRDRRRFAYTADQRCFLDLNSPEPSRVYCEPPYFWTLQSGADHSDNPYGLGLAHQLFWPVRFKRDGLRFWLVYLEKFGMPTAVGKFKAGSSPDVRNKLLEAVRAVQTEAGIIIPDDCLIELLEAKRSGSSDYEAFQRRMDAAIQKIIVGQTLTAEVGENGGNRALGGIHMSVRQDLVKGDSDLICESFNRGPARWLTELNFRGAAVPRVIREVEQGEDLDALASQFEKLARVGYRPDLATVQAAWGAGMVEAPRPVPVALPGRPGLPGAPGAQDGAAFAAVAQALFPDQDALDGALDAYEGRLDALGTDLVDPFLAYASGHSPAEMLAALSEALPGWEPGQLTDALARVIFTAQTLGRVYGGR